MKNNEKLSKYISLILRHKPEVIGLSLDEEGYLYTSDLIIGINNSGKEINNEVLDKIVEEDLKKRYSYNFDKSKIRANQGHSIPVDIGLSSVKPPSILYHGSSYKYFRLIKSEGLISKERNHVHLSESVSEAMVVARRRKDPILLKVNSNEMYEKGYEFFQSVNGVWLTDKVPSEYIEYVS